MANEFDAGLTKKFLKLKYTHFDEVFERRITKKAVFHEHTLIVLFDQDVRI